MHRRHEKRPSSHVLALLSSLVLVWTSVLPTTGSAQAPDAAGSSSVVISGEAAPEDDAATAAALDAAAPDLVSPTIVHEPEGTGVAGEPQRFEARVSDNVGVGAVTLFHRRAGETEFESVEMRSVGDDRYVATVRSDDDRVGVIEYFIQAADLAGTRTTRASNLSPLERALEAPPAAPEITFQDEPRTAEKAGGGRRTLWYVVGGVLAAVAIAALVDVDGEPDESCDGSCTLEFVVDAPR